MKHLRTYLKNNFPDVLALFGLQQLQDSSKYVQYSSSSFSRFAANITQNALETIFEIGSSMEENSSTQTPCSSCQEYLDGWKRALADYDNLKKELAKEKEKIRMSVKEDIVFRLLPIMDHFSQAFAHEPEGISTEVKGWMQGLLHIRRQMEEELRGFGLEAYASVGDLFDPYLHEAVEERMQEDAADGTILEVQQQGWRLQDHVVRPARVVVNHLSS